MGLLAGGAAQPNVSSQDRGEVECETRTDSDGRRDRKGVSAAERSQPARAGNHNRHRFKFVSPGNFCVSDLCNRQAVKAPPRADSTLNPSAAKPRQKRIVHPASGYVDSSEMRVQNLRT